MPRMTNEKQLELILQRLDELFRSRTAMNKMSDDDRVLLLEKKIEELQTRVKSLEKLLSESITRERGKES